MSIENPFDSQPPASSETTPEIAHGGFRVGQKVEFDDKDIEYTDSKSSQPIETGGGWEIKDFITRTAGDKVFESAKIVSANGVEEIVSIGLLRAVAPAELPSEELNISTRLDPDQSNVRPPLAEPAELATPLDDFKLATRLQPEAPDKTLPDLAEPAELAPTSSETSQQKEFQRGDPVKVLNKSTGQLEDGWFVDLVVAHESLADGGVITLRNPETNRTRNESLKDVVLWNTAGSSFTAEPTPEQSTPAETATEKPKTAEPVVEAAQEVESPVVEQAPQSPERKEATPEISAEVQAQAQELLAAFRRGFRPRTTPWALRTVMEAYGMTPREIKDSTPVQLFERLQTLVHPEIQPESTPETTPTPEIEPAEVQPDTAATLETEPPFHDRQPISYLTPQGDLETDWTIFNPSNVWTGFIPIQKSNGRVEFVALDDLKKWNQPVAETIPEPEAETTPELVETENKHQEFEIGQEVQIENKDGSMESGWFISQFTVMPSPVGDLRLITLRSTNGEIKIIPEERLRQWNTMASTGPSTVDTTAATAETTQETANNQEITAEKYSPEWVHQVLRQFNINPSELAGFDQLTAGQQALALENFQSVMIDQVQTHSEAAYNKKSADTNLLGKVWRGMFKEVYLAKEKRAALTSLEAENAELKKAILQQSIEGLQKQHPEIDIENGTLTLQYLNAERLGITGEPSYKQLQVIKQFNIAANDLASIPDEWRLTGNKKQQEQYQQAERLYRMYSDSLLNELSLTQDAPAVELALNKANYDIQLQRLLTSHPEVEQEFQKIRSPKIWLEALKTHFTEKGLYTTAGYATRWSAATFLGTASTWGIALAAPVIGGWRSYERSKRTLKERARLSRKGVVDTSKQASHLTQDVTKNVSDYRARLLADQQEGELLLQQAKTPEDQAAVIARLDYIKDQLAAPDEELAGGKGGLVTRLEDLKQRLEAETDPEKKATLQGRLMRRINYTNLKLSEGLVNFGTADQRVLNHYHLMQTMGEAVALVHEFKPTLQLDENQKQLTQHEKIERRLENFIQNQLHIEDKDRRAYIIEQTAKGAALGLTFSTIGYLLSHFSELARGGLHATDQHQDAGQALDQQPTSGATQETIDLSKFEVASHQTAPLQPVEVAPTAPSEPLTEIAQRGDSAWKLTERHLSEHFKDKFQNLNEAQKTYLVDAIKDKMQAHPEQFGFQAGQSIDQLQEGQTINFDAITKDQAVADLLFKHANELQPEQMANIVHNNEIIHHWVVNNPGESLTADNVGAIIDGTHQLGLTPEIIEQAATEGGKNMLTIDQELPYTTVNEFINQALYGHPQGHEALIAQVQEALHDNNYLDNLESAHHYDPRDMTAGWLKTDRGQDWLDKHNGEIWNQDGRAYTVVQETASSAKKVAEKSTETAKKAFETVGAYHKKLELDLVTANTAPVGRRITMWAIYRAK